MGHPHTVLHSFNLTGESVCVDIFRRANGSFGFDEFRKDPEDDRGWYSIGHHGHRVFATQEDALDAAKQDVGWLSEQI